MGKNSNGRDNSSQFMTFAEVQDLLGIKSRKTLLKYIREGKLRAFKLGGTRWRVRNSDVMSFIQTESGEI